jgi:uncharacterized SAM-binding protein YcdF (DUF218 family)
LRHLKGALLCAAAALLLAGLAAWLPGWFIDFSDVPRKADMIVVLAGAYSRPFYAADLYREGLAPEIWLSRPYRPPSELKAVSLGVPIPAEEENNRAILLRLGVSADKIHLYGASTMSTANEAVAFRRAADPRGKTVLVVTSRWHARRAKWVFRHDLPGARVLVCATPYEEFSRRWWSSQDLARGAIMESAKMLYYLLGGRFLNPLEDTPYVR